VHDVHGLGVRADADEGVLEPVPVVPGDQVVRDELVLPAEAELRHRQVDPGVARVGRVEVRHLHGHVVAVVDPAVFGEDQHVLVVRPAAGKAQLTADQARKRREIVRRRVWVPALAVVGLEGIHFHDLRHTGNQLTANAGANPKELMVRMGHDSERAAMIYLHSSRERQRALADAVGKAARVELAESKPRNQSKPSGTQRARNRRTGSEGGV
jgi:hypothetical protein